MRYLFGGLFAGLAAVVLSAGQAGASDVEIKGPHICCGQCVTAVNKILAKVDGVSAVKADKDTKTVTFTAKDSAAATAGFKALLEGGFFGSATEDGKAIKVEVAAGKKDKLESVTVKDVHACCGMCHKAIKGLFKDAKVTIEGSGAQRTIVIQGTDLQTSSILAALRKTGFNGTIEK